MTTGGATTGRRSGRILSVQKAVALLRLFSEQQPELGLAAMAEALRMPKSTVHGLVRTLEECGMIRQNPVSGTYRLGAVAFQLGYVANLRSELSQQALPFLETLLDETQQIIYLAIPYEGLVLYIDALYPPRRKIRYSVAGRTTYMHATALGKAMLSQMEPDQIDWVIARHGLPRLTESTIVDRETLLRQIALTKERGYALDNRESDPMIACVAVPFRTMSGQPGGAISISGPFHAFGEESVAQYVHKLAHVSSELSKRVSRLPF